MSSANEVLSKGVGTVPKIGPAREDALNKLGIFTVADLLTCLPKRYIHRKTTVPLAEIEDGDDTTALVNIIKTNFRPRGRRGNLTLRVEDDSGEATVVFFNIQRWMVERLKPGTKMLIWGKAARNSDGLNFAHPDFDFENDGVETLIPIYPNAAQLSSVGMGRKLRAQIALDTLKIFVDLFDPIPEKILNDVGLLGFFEALKTSHSPANWESLIEARRRFAFDELLLLQLLFALRRRKAQTDDSAFPIKPGRLFDQLGKSLPYTLTDGQKHALANILEELNSPGRNMLLLSGDVGSGKTIVALLAAAAAIDSGLQVAVMVPSLLVARQHADFIQDIIPDVRVGLLTGESCSKELTKRLRSGDIDIVVGTQALLSQSVEFKRLGLVVFDEQHRFGVRQRLSLSEWHGAHTLQLTATPIPRTAALALYGDLSLHTLRGFPKQRAGVKTYLRQNSKRESVWDFMAERLREGERVFVVHPRIEGDDFSSAVFGYERLRERFGTKVALLHGGMSLDDKNDIFSAFRGGEKPILATTSLVEIGLDVPEATVVLIESADSFGLAQLHQLRGRVGRAKKQGYCILLTGRPRGSKRWNRLERFSRTQDGFKIARQDLMERGEGEIFQLAQTGPIDLEFAEPLRMPKLLDSARRWAMKIISDDPELKSVENAGLARGVSYIYKRKQITTSAV